MFNTLLYQPLLKTLAFLTGILGGSLGFAIIALTFLIRTAMIPLSLPSMRSAEKLRELKPHLDDLKRKHSKDKKRLQQEQLNLYREHGINPAAGCLPTIIQFAVLIALYKVFIDFLQNGDQLGLTANLQFLWLDLSKPDPLYVLPVVAGVSQFILSKMLMAGREQHSSQDLKQKGKEEKSTQDTAQDMAEAMQQQMLYVMPAMTALIALRLPSGLAVYWVATTVFSLIQQYVISGPGGLRPILDKVKGG